MKKEILQKILYILLLYMVSFSLADAQVVTMTGPSSRTATPPTSATAVGMLLATGGNISLKVGTTSTATDIVYQWYKQDSTGTKHLIQQSSTSTLQETASIPGYYIYQLVTSNSNQCTSEISDPFKVYVLPTLNPNITASSSSVCANGTNTATLTANVANTSFSYQYQWGLNGSDISGATSATYTASAGSSGTNNYTVKVSYSLKNSVSGTANQTVNVVAMPAKPSISVGQ